MVTYRITSVGSLNLGQAFNICVEHVHLLYQACESGLRRLTHLLIHSFGLDTEMKNHIGSLYQNKSHKSCNVLSADVDGASRLSTY